MTDFNPASTYNEDYINARIEALFSLKTDAPLPLEIFQSLREEAARTLGEGHEATLRLDEYIVLERRHDLGVAAVAKGLADLANTAAAKLGPEHRRTRILNGEAARFARLAGDPDWRRRYQELIDREMDVTGGADLRRISIKRSNLAFALASQENTPEEIREGYAMAQKEYEWRLDKYGENDPFVYVPRIAMLRAALYVLRRGETLLHPDRMLDIAHEVVAARARLLGSQHRTTLVARQLLFEIQAEHGDAEQARWNLASLPDRRRDPNNDAPELLELALARAAGLCGDLVELDLWGAKAIQTAIDFYGETRRTDAIRRAIATFRADCRAKINPA